MRVVSLLFTALLVGALASLADSAARGHHFLPTFMLVTGLVVGIGLLVNLGADPHFTFHLKHGVKADLPAEAEVITDPAERRRVLADIVDDFNDRNGAPGSPWPKAVLDEWVERSPLALVRFEEAG